MRARKLNVAIVGLGRVGQALFQRLIDEEKNNPACPFHVQAACARTPHETHYGVTFTTNYRTILQAENIDLVVELVGGVTHAYDVVTGALDSGKHVVTNNRPLMASHGGQLLKVAAGNRVHLRFNGAILTGLPVMESFLEGGSQHVRRLYGVLSATCNYALARMYQTGSEMENAIEAAVELGLAEKNAYVDTSGKDSLHKLKLLRGAAFGQWENPQHSTSRGLEGITSTDVRLTKRMGYAIKLVSEADETSMSVAPKLVDELSMMAAVSGSMAGIVVEGETTGTRFYAGNTEGVEAQVDALMQDVMAIASGRRLHPLQRPHAPKPKAKGGLHTYYLRMPAGVAGQFNGGNVVKVLEQEKDAQTSQTALLVESTLPLGEVASYVKSDDKLALEVFRA